VVRLLQEKFGDRFDVIFPATSGDVDPTQINVDLQLKNVTASEIFSAMNLQFELGKSPYRWELTLNGSRQVALLRYLPQLGPPPAPAPVPVRKVFFVGDMLGDFPGTNDVQKLHGLSDEVFNVWDQTKMRGGDVEIYPPGQSLIVSGTPGAVDLAEQTLRALKEKAVYESSHPQPQRVKSE
ncbi:MAG TPA: hypothetical protein VGV18_12780, partial [Verrucomicrobiae bacterium]|nr:hypothetical protein [Verrucomicrobiae bacterium]